jgi:dimethylargininase
MPDYPIPPITRLRNYPMLLAITRSVPVSIGRCELTHLAREPIDHARAVVEHAQYEAALTALGCRVERLPDAPDLPDSVFVEDAAVVVDEVAVIARPGAASRRAEVEAMANALRPHRPLAFIEPPGTLDGGDVLVAPRKVFVGISGRTNEDGVGQLRSALALHGYEVIAVPVIGCLHLKSAVTAVFVPPEGGRSILVINPDWVDRGSFDGFELIEVDPSEPAAANVLQVGERVICAEEHPKTRERLSVHGLVTIPVPAGELAKAEGGVTCCSVILSVTHHSLLSAVLGP